MMTIAYNTSTLLISLSLLIGFYRLFIGPGFLNRILAFDLISLCVIALTVIFSLTTSCYHFVEIMIVFCLIGFATTIAFMDMLFRGLDEREDSNE